MPLLENRLTKNLKRERKTGIEGNGRKKREAQGTLRKENKQEH
jgi:hypothetical protein